MLIEFSVGNFLSFRDIQTLHLQATKIRSRFEKVDKENVFPVNDDLSLLKSKAIFGANAGGKSNVIRAIVAMLTIIRDGLKDEEVLPKFVTPFLFQEENLIQPSFFQLVFILDNVQYRYGFEASSERIHSEWLFGKPLNEKGVRERYYFTREGMSVSVNEMHFKEGSRLQDKAPLFRENSLFLAVSAAFNGPITQGLLHFFRSGISSISGLEEGKLLGNAALQAMSDPIFVEKATRLLQAVDPGIQKLERVEEQVLLFRNRYDASGKIKEEAPLLLNFAEAEGTKKLFHLSPLLFSVLEKGSILFIDELDARMHPKLTRKVVELFHTNNTNPHNAQLIFVTHDSNLLDAHLLRRDQISFAKKDRQGATELYSLVEYKGVRNDASYEKDYLLGKYEAVPENLNVLEELFVEYQRHGKKNKKD